MYARRPSDMGWWNMQQTGSSPTTDRHGWTAAWTLAYRERDALAYPAVHSVVLCRWDAMIGRVPAHLGVAEESEIPGQEDASSSNDGVQVHRTDDGVQVRRSDDDI